MSNEGKNIYTTREAGQVLEGMIDRFTYDINLLRLFTEHPDKVIGTTATIVSTEIFTDASLFDKLTIVDMRVEYNPATHGDVVMVSFDEYDGRFNAEELFCTFNENESLVLDKFGELKELVNAAAN